MLIYKLLGDQAQQEFARSWGVSYAMNVASEWKDVLVGSLKGMVILAILERLYVTRAASWFEDHIGVCGLLGWQKVLSCWLNLHTQTTIAFKASCSATRQ